MNAYEKFLKKELILRDKLAIDRTLLANERTFLSYIRASLILAIAGGTLIKFVSEMSLHILGWILLVVALITLIIGFLRFTSIRKAMKKIS